MDVSEVKVLARRANGILFGMPVFMLLSGFCLVYSILALTDVIVPDKETLHIIYLFSGVGRRRRGSFYYGFGYRRRIFEQAWDNEFVYGLDFSDDELVILNRYSLDGILWGCIFYYGLFFLACLFVFLARLSVPRIIMEYDDFGLYIYRTGKPVTLLRYKEIWSTYSEEDFENVEFCYHRGFYRCRNIKVSNPFWGIFKTGSIRIEIPDGFINLGGIYHVREVEREIKRMVKNNRQEFIDELEENIKANQRQRELEELAKHNPNT